MTTRLYLIRHGATQLTAEDRFSGAANVYLSEEGRAQAERLARRLADRDRRYGYIRQLLPSGDLRARDIRDGGDGRDAGGLEHAHGNLLGGARP